MDCKFDNGTSRKFGLDSVPEFGKPFVKYSLNDSIITADYYYDDWVERYSKEIWDQVFTKEYHLFKGY